MFFSVDWDHDAPGNLGIHCKRFVRKNNTLLSSTYQQESYSQVTQRDMFLLSPHDHFFNPRSPFLGSHIFRRNLPISPSGCQTTGIWCTYCGAPGHTRANCPLLALQKRVKAPPGWWKKVTLKKWARFLWDVLYNIIFIIIHINNIQYIYIYTMDHEWQLMICFNIFGRRSWIVIRILRGTACCLQGIQGWPWWSLATPERLWSLNTMFFFNF